MTPRAHAILRLYAVQASWTYERMSGIGVGHASVPLLRTMHADRPIAERRAAVARSAGFFNSHPYLASVAVGAVTRAEQDDVPGAAITRLRMALSGPLGALGDQLVWAGEVPALVGFALTAVPWIGMWAVVALVVIHNVLRFRLTVWGFDLGFAHSLRVGAALQQSWLPRAADIAQRAAAFAVGLAIPLISAWLLRPNTRNVHYAVTLVGSIGVVLTVLPATRSRITGFRFGLAALLIAACVAGAWR